MKNEEILRKLYLIAQAQMNSRAVIATRTFRRSLSETGQELYKLSLQVRKAKALDDDQVLLSFLTFEANKLLFKHSPNLFTLFQILQEATLNAQVDGNFFPITSPHVGRAIAHLRQDALRFNLARKAVQDLTATEAALSASNGWLIIERQGDDYSLAQHPLFYELVFDPHAKEQEATGWRKVR